MASSEIPFLLLALGTRDGSSSLLMHESAGVEECRMSSAWKSANNAADRLFAGYASIVVRFTAPVCGLGVLLAVAFSLGLLLADVDKRNVSELWIDLDSRLVSEKAEFEKYFGGLTRQLTSIVTPSTAGESLFSGDDTATVLGNSTSNGLAALQQAMRIWENITFTYEGNTYGPSDVCEKPVVPFPFRRNQSSAELYGRFSQCMQTETGFTSFIYPSLQTQYSALPANYTPVPPGWGIDEFPCSRASTLDCFREGEEVDWPIALRQLGHVSLPLATAVTTTYGAFLDEIARTPVDLSVFAPGFPTLTVVEIVLSGFFVPCWFFTHDGNLQCLLASSVDLSTQPGRIAGVNGSLNTLITPQRGSLDQFDPSGSLRGAVTAALSPVVTALPSTTSRAELETLAEQATQIVLRVLQPVAGSNALVGSLLLYLNLNRRVKSGQLPAASLIGSRCLGAAVAGHLGVAPGSQSAAVQAASAELVEVAQFFSSVGYYWRPSYRTMTASQVVEHVNSAANAQLDPAVRGDLSACIRGVAKCCQAWNGAFVGTSIHTAGTSRPGRRRVPRVGFSSLDLSSITLVRAGWEDYHHNSPQWQDQLQQRYPSVQWNSERRREDLARAFDEKLTNEWLKLYERQSGSSYGPGEQFSSMRFDFSTGNSLTDILEQAGSVEGSLLGLSYGVMAVLVVLSLSNLGGVLVNWSNKDEMQLALVDSHGGLGLAGLAVIGLSSAAGLGFSAFVQITLNGLTINLAPFVSLGLGIDDMFVFAHALITVNDRRRSPQDNMGDVLRLAGPSVCLTSFANAAAFILVYVVPVSAVRQLVLVLMVSVLVNLIFLFLIFVPIMVYDMRRNHAGRMDLCFLEGPTRIKDSTSEKRPGLIAQFIDKAYAPFLSNVAVKIAVLVVFGGFCIAMLWHGIVSSKHGLRTSDIALRDTYQRDVAILAEDVIPIQKSTLVTVVGKRQFSDPVAQEQVINLLNSLDPSPHIVNGTRAHDLNFLTNSTASILFLYDRQRSSGALPAQLQCPAAGVSTPITSKPCYDAIFPVWLATAGAGLTPYLYCQGSGGKRAPCGSPGAVLMATRTDFYMDGLREHQDHLDAIKDIRARVDPYSNSDVQVYPTGYVFYFWEQYFGIVTTLISAIGFGLLGVFIITFVFQLNPWLSLIVCSVILMIEVELIGLMPVMNVNLNAISIANLVISIGMAVEFTAHYARAFLLASGSRNQRMKTALHEMLQPMINGALSTIIALSVLSANKFPFFRNYYALTFVVMVLIAFVNGLLLLPVLLSLIGPPARECNAAVNEATHDAVMEDIGDKQQQQQQQPGKETV